MNRNFLIAALLIIACQTHPRATRTKKQPTTAQQEIVALQKEIARTHSAAFGYPDMIKNGISHEKMTAFTTLAQQPIRYAPTHWQQPLDDIIRSVPDAITTLHTITATSAKPTELTRMYAKLTRNHKILEFLSNQLYNERVCKKYRRAIETSIITTKHVYKKLLKELRPINHHTMQELRASLKEEQKPNVATLRSIAAPALLENYNTIPLSPKKRAKTIKEYRRLAHTTTYTKDTAWHAKNIFEAMRPIIAAKQECCHKSLPWIFQQKKLDALNARISQLEEQFPDLPLSCQEQQIIKIVT